MNSERQTKPDPESYIENLECATGMFIDIINAMHSDFIEVVKDGKSPCFFCVNDETCLGEENCNFFWKKHNLGGQDND